jgi:DNA-directed RNA polymerase II subunit RPB2
MTDSLPDYRHILQTFVEQSDGKQLISHQVESFNQFIEVDIPEIIHMSNPITSYGSPEIPLAGPRSALATATGLSTTAANALMGSSSVDGIGLVAKKVQHEYEVTLEFEKISIRKPTIFENNGAIHPMMPNDARLRNLTYAAPLNVDVKVTTTFIDHTRGSIRESNVRVFPNVHLGKIPVMVGSKYCLLHDQKHIHPSTLGECAEDVGGYFIIQGGERAMISMERMSENRPFVFRNGRVAAKQMEIVEIKCIGPDNDQVPKSNTVKIVYHPKNQLITMLRATVPRIKTEIPVVILFRALGVLADKEIYELILGAVETSQEDVYDPILIESILEASGIRTQEEALAWLGEHTNTWSVKSQKQGNVQDIISEELFPQIGGHEMNYEKACFLAHMCRKVLWTITKRIPTDDRDAYPNKRVDIPGFLLADLFRKTYNNRMVKDMKAALSKEIHGGSWKATGNWTEIVNINNINKIIKSTIMDVCLKSSLATGNFGCGKIGGPNKVGVSQVLNRMNYSAGISHLRRISTPIEKTGKLIAPRKQHNSQCGFICPCETPEGHGVGVVKNMAMTTMITIFSSPATVYAFIQRMDKLVSLRDSTIQQKHSCTRVFLNGAWIGVLLDEDAQDVVDRLRKAKRAGVLHLYTGIIWKNAYKELWLTTEAGRVIRPIYYAPTLREVAADKSGTLKQQILAIREWNNLLRWQTPSGKNLFEYIDAGETDGAYLAMDYAKAISDPTTTHCEIHPSVILGTTASYIPFPDHNQSPRNAYQSSMGKQAMGIYALNFRERFDAMSHVLCYPEVPMVSTFMSRFYGAQKLPAGQNIVVAIMTYTGYNQEDSNMINRAALDRGRFRSIFYRTYKDEERKNQSSGEEEKFCRPEPTETKHMKNAHYDKIGDDGFIPRNTYVTPDDILIGKVVPLRVPTGAVLPAGAKKSRDVSKMPRNNEKGYVDKIYKNRNGEGYSFVKIRMRQDRIPEIGDKFSCYSDDTDVLTARGWIRFPELTMEDQVATLMEDEKTMQYTKPLEVMSYDYTGNMYSIQSNQVDLMVTPNHRMYVGNRNGEKFGFQLAEDVYGKRLCYKKNVESYTPTIIGRPTELSYIHLESGEMMQEAQSFIVRGVHTANMINRTDKYIPMDDWLIMFGIWMAEGSASATYVDFATNKLRVREELDRIGSACGIKFIKGVSRKTDDVNTSYRICSLNYSQYFHPLSVGSTNKSLPAWVWYLTTGQCQTLIRGMMLGDGHTMTNGTRRYDTSSKQLADDFQRLCFHAGYSSNINLKYAAGHETVVKKQGHNYENKIIRSTTDAYRLTIIEKQCIPLVNKNITQTGEKRLDSWVPYDGKVYCCRVQGPGAVYVRRNNVPVWSGNSRHGSFEPYSAG